MHKADTMALSLPEIPITPEMLTAGVMEAMKYSSCGRRNEALVARVFRVMIASFPDGKRSWAAVFAAAPVTEWMGDV